ncbi:MAG: TIM barrel protein [Candidatus Brevundimonas phytovorans]|nr:TIM barrel protein [Brevundimonas sp.]WEK56753.1 MAG: TIM barrel protein [Brevundimonas sp.]
MRRLSLDHITVVDATPSQLIETAAAVGCRGACLFLHSMPVLAAMPVYDLMTDAAERRRTREAMAAHGVTLDMVYPFTVTGRSAAADFAPLLETAAELGGRRANVLCYDREPARRLDLLGRLGEQAAAHGLALAIEFYPPSQVRTLDEAFDLIEALGRDDAGVTLDLLHLARSGGLAGDPSRLADPRILIAQVCDGAAETPLDQREFEAGAERRLPGAGDLKSAAFVSALAADLPLSIEAPRQSALVAGLSIQERAQAAVTATRMIMGEATWRD